MLRRNIRMAVTQVFLVPLSVYREATERMIVLYNGDCDYMTTTTLWSIQL